MKNTKNNINTLNNINKTKNKNNIKNKNHIKNNINNIGKARVNIKEETRDDSSKATDGMEFLEYLWRKD